MAGKSGLKRTGWQTLGLGLSESSTQGWPRLSNPADVGSLAVEEPPWLINMGTPDHQSHHESVPSGSLLPWADKEYSQ